MPSPKAVSIELTAGEREQLESWSRRRTTAQALALRSRIVLAAAEGLSSTQVAKDLGVSVATVEKHVRNCLRKLGARNRAHAIALALHLGEIEIRLRSTSS